MKKVLTSLLLAGVAVTALTSCCCDYDSSCEPCPAVESRRPCPEPRAKRSCPRPHIYENCCTNPGNYEY